MPKRKPMPKKVVNDIVTRGMDALIPQDAPQEIQNEGKLMLKNGLSEAIMGQGWGTPGWGTQLSQTDTLFKNNRWYLVSNMRQLISQCYVEHGLVQTVIDVPVDDAMRGGIEITSKQLSEDQIDQILNEIEREGDLMVVGQACKWNRLFGGAAIITITDQDPTQPLVIEAIKEGSPLKFRAVDMWELFWSFQNTSDTSAVIDAHELTGNTHYDYYGVQLHNTRVMRLIGIEAPSFVRPRLRGWGCSIMETLVRSINQYLKSNNLSFEILDEFKIDVYKIKDLASSALTTEGQANIQRRIQLANQQKNFQHAVTMDKEDDWDHKQLSFSGLAETMQGIRLQVAADMRMPLTKIFGTGAQGFNSGEDDIEVYNAMVESQVRAKIKYEILRIIELRCQRAFGMIPDDLKIDFKPLRVLSSEQEENVKTQKFARLLQAKQAGEISSQEFKEGCNRDKLLPIQLDPTVDSLLVDEGNVQETDATEAPKAPISTISAKDTPEVKNEMIRNPGNVDEALWKKAKEKCKKEYGTIKWPIVTTIYKEMGGTFS